MVGGFKHGFIFHFIYGMSSFPLTNSLHHFSRWAHCTTNQMVVRIYTRLPWPSWRQRWRQMLCWGDGSPGVSWGHGGKFTSGVWDFTVVAMAISELTDYFYGIIHSINGVFLVLITGILGHNCRGKMRRNRSLRTRFCWRFSWPLNGLKDVRAPPLDPWFVITHISSHQWGSSMNLIGFLFIPLRFVGLTTPQQPDPEPDPGHRGRGLLGDLLFAQLAASRRRPTPWGLLLSLRRAAAAAGRDASGSGNGGHGAGGGGGDVGSATGVGHGGDESDAWRSFFMCVWADI